MAALHIAGGVIGGVPGLRLDRALAPHQVVFCRVSSGAILAVAATMLVRTAGSFGI